ncbi:GGDEF domain-containing protein [Cytobacillus spongiae]|jgi:diguanylate cyclase (GGDEF)-like protein|uniref:GGDEF domain-containing protein n=1 Tax=Cytobacillus spongiae TaxID=2901381 RepID=UPI001F2E4D43|nr:GGDEF domain-containing protein [Cytobacillus spongiae]UII57208.1 GGDEF domain-containing protein [Cytobacillus spongiae]
MISYIGDIAEEVPFVQSNHKSSEIYEIFEHSPLIEGIVVLDDDRPIGLVMKTKFYHKLSSKYGFDVYMGRQVELLMTENPLIVDYYTPITEVSSLAMNRKQDDLYDYIIVEKNREVIGIVNIKNLLIKIAEEQVLIARHTNPLTGLPGNTLIKEKVIEALKLSHYTILYADLDHFKGFNDVYGFSKGDDLIRETANILNKYVLLKQKEKAFVGHIGGDDFIAILPHYEYNAICDSIIMEFTQVTSQFYSDEDLNKGHILVPNRKGELEETPLCSISIAVVTNEARTFSTVDEISEEATRLKKICKQQANSCFVHNNINNEKKSCLSCV